MSAAGTEITDRDAWLAGLDDNMGASEAAGALGVHPHTTPVEVYLRKVGLIPRAEETDAMRWGLWAEPMLAEEYARRTGQALERTQVFKLHDAYPELRATLDGIDAAGDLVELKTINERAAQGRLGEEWSDKIPEEWLCQAAQQMAVFGADRVLFGVKVWGGPFRIYEVRRDDTLVTGVVDGVRRFWHDHVLARVMPEVGHRDAEVFRRIQPTPGREIELDDRAEIWARTYLDLGRQMKDLRIAHDLAQAELLAAIGDASIATGSGGLVVKRTTVNRRAYTSNVKASTYHRLSVSGEEDSE